MPAPIPTDEDRRLQALRDCCVLDTAPEAGFDEITAIAAEMAVTPIALISLIDEDRQWFKSRVGLDVEETPRDLAFCAYAILESGPLIVEDARNDERFKDNPLVVGPPGIRFYAGFPLELASGERLGTLCVIDDRPRIMSDACRRLLHRLSREAATSLELRRSVDRLRKVSAERADMIEELRGAKEQLDAASHAKSDFLASMSHEIRTPMTAILGFLDLIDQSGADETQRRAHVATIRRNARHLLGLINGILDLSKVEAGKMTLERIPTDPVTVAREVEAIMRVRADEKGIALRVEVETALPATVATDPVRLHQILTNFVANAIRFTDSGGVTIRLRLDRARHGPELRIAVADTGMGIDPAQCARLFEAFEQGDASTTRRFGGSGLGLRIAHCLAELLGGRIAVESEPGGGSTFTLILPVADEEAAVLREPPDSPSSAAPIPATTPPATSVPASMASATPSSPVPDAGGAARPTPLRGLRILVADDAPDNRLLLSRFLERAGATVTLAEDGAEAVAAAADAAARSTRFDLIVLDMQMPRMNGFEAAARLRELGDAPPVLALTAGAMVGEREKCLEAGCDDYLTKPIDPPEFVSRCADLARREA